MANNIELLIKHFIKQNNHSLNIAFPAVIVGVGKITDSLVDVKPLINYINPLTNETEEYPVLQDISLVFPNTKNSSISFPVNQGDFVDLLVQSVDIQKYVLGNDNIHDPNFLSHGNLANVVAIVGFTSYQKSCLNPNNYKNEFNNQDLNIVHNKNSDNEAIVSINTDGDITLKSPTKVLVESPKVEVLADEVEANNAVISTQGDVEIQGRSVKQFMDNYDLHTHIGNQGSPTSAPNI